MLLLLYIAALLVTTGGTQVTTTLELLLENGLQVTSQHIVQKRVTIIYPVESESVISENFAKIRSVSKGWTELKLFSTESQLKTDLLNLLSVGNEYYLKAGSYMKHLVSFTSDSDKVPSTSCNFTGKVLTSNNMVEDSSVLVSMIDKIDDTWTVETVTKDIAKLNFLYSIANTYNSIGFEWNQITAASVSEYDQLRKLDFPDNLHGHLETVVCLEPVALESIKVLSCDSNRNLLFCEIEVSVPQNSASYGLFQILNYQGAQLRGPSGREIFVRNPENQEIMLLLCKDDIDLVHPEVPICSKVDDMHKCLVHLLRHEIDDAIANCKFEYREVTTVTRLETEELLIQGNTDTQVTEGQKVIFQSLPLVIGSKEKVTISIKNGEEYEYHGSGTKQIGIKVSKLSKIQINLLLIKATWDDAVRGFSIHDYVEYLALLLQLLFAPLTIVAVVLACVAKRNHNRKKKMTEKERTHCNYRENRTLLKGKNKR